MSSNPTHLRVDVAGIPIYVRSEHERSHLEQVNRKLAETKLALMKTKKVLADAPNQSNSTRNLFTFTLKWIRTAIQDTRDKDKALELIRSKCDRLLLSLEVTKVS